jgi:hypothetical protein
MHSIISIKILIDNSFSKAKKYNIDKFYNSFIVIRLIEVNIINIY